MAEAYVGQWFGSVEVEIMTSDRDEVRIAGHKLSYDEAIELCEFVRHQIYQVRKNRGEYDWT